ncbi:alpha-hydroxy-acid oxidizing protein [Sutcliffiella horikoshii]|uniref:L-lactate oxidase n=1 Tax=Sutcliffiella horikoshii TaxID=79883 RepID=A0AA94WR23_9BACI|nr:alpha-hydroxy-acid oxidizing protein [Sutcliffiella horikoshii]TYS59622.1 alpha-hydroxy-acid oxidizing protein [Sutcliffiella horikoshii]
MKLYHFADLEKKAESILDSHPFTYIKSGSGDEETMGDNIADLRKWKIRPKFLRDVSKRDLSISLFGKNYKTPYLLAPVGNLGIVHPEAELAVSRAAKQVGIPIIASTVTSFSLEEIAAEAGDRWFQLYCSSDMDITLSFIRRAEQAGYEAIVITVDMPALGFRVADLTNQYAPFKLGAASGNYFSDPVFQEKLACSPSKDFQRAVDEQLKHLFAPGFSWEDVAVLRKATTLPILLKGILHPSDAKKAIEYELDGIIVSNHGGRQLDGCISSIAALPAVVNEVGGRIPVLFDSGIRKGTDVVKALALGADAVLLGRPYVYGLAINGKEGVQEVLDNFIYDLDATMATAGVDAVSALTRDILVRK